MIQLTQLTKKFNSKLAVNQLNMILEPGQVMGLIGQNGAGKTTTFRMILNFITPTSGTITWDNHPITQQDKQRIGFLPEERGLYQKLTIEEQILYFAELHGMRRADARTALADWLKRLDVVGKATDKVQSLSKGNAQKVQMIASLIFNPEFIILDEPFSGLDPVNTSIMMNEIIRMRDQGAMIIFSSHDMDNVTKISDQLTMLKKVKSFYKVACKKFVNSLVGQKSTLKGPSHKPSWPSYQGLLVSPHTAQALTSLSQMKLWVMIFSTMLPETATFRPSLNNPQH